MGVLGSSEVGSTGSQQVKRQVGVDRAGGWRGTLGGEADLRPGDRRRGEGRRRQKNKVLLQSQKALPSSQAQEKQA